MSRFRRISIRVEQRVTSVSVTQTTEISGDSGAAQGSNCAGPPPGCPDCGAPWIPDFAAVLGKSAISLEALQSAILDRRLHLHPLPDGQFRVCELSFQRILETP